MLDSRAIFAIERRKLELIVIGRSESRAHKPGLLSEAGVTEYIARMDLGISNTSERFRLTTARTTLYSGEAGLCCACCVQSPGLRLTEPAIEGLFLRILSQFLLSVNSFAIKPVSSNFGETEAQDASRQGPSCDLVDPC
jgi:hypothetical protein